MNKLTLWMAAITVCAVAGTALGQSEAFTYQGQLKLQGVPLSAEVDMKFTLFDSESATEAVAGPLLFDGIFFTPIQVTNGLFSAELDFGPGALQLGQWLEIEVRSPHDPSDASTYTPLTPRQRISAAPFALSVPGLATTQAGVEIEGDIHAIGQIAASAYTSNSPLIFKVNPLDMECARFEDQQCYLGLGTPTPQARLHIGGVAGVDGIMFPDGSMQTSAAGLGGGDGFWSLSGTKIYNNNGGNVGIGTPNPLAKLEILGDWNGVEGALRIRGDKPTIGLSGGPLTNNTSWVMHLGSNPAGLLTFARNLTPSTFSYLLNLTPDDRVGIGTRTPLSKLDISAFGEGAELLRFTTERPWVFRQVRTGPSAGLQLYSTVGQKLFEITAVGGENVATFVADGPNSKVGIGTISPTSRLDIVGQDGLGITGFQPFMTLRDSNAGNARGRIQNAGGSIHFFTEASFASGVAPLSVLNSGRVKVNILEVAGADLAEKFPSNDKDVKSGTVMEIDSENPGKLRVSREAYSSRVAGVVSGAGDIPVGAILGNLPGNEDAPAIALSGRVWVQCDASNGAIVAGDLLTTSAAPGYAMKASDRERSHGAVLGKAMTTLTQGERGLVLVLVNLQ